MAILKVDTISGIGTEGPVFEGDIEFTSQNFLTLPKGDTTQRGRGRGLIMGGTSPSVLSTIQYVEIQSLGNFVDFGALAVQTNMNSGSSSSTRGLSFGGKDTTTNVIQFVTIATTSNASDFGDLTLDRRYSTSASNNTRSVTMGGYKSTSPATYSNIIDFVTIATTGDASDFGDITVARVNGGAVNSPTRGVMCSGQIDGSPYPRVNTIDFVTIASTGNATDFGDVTQKRRGAASASSNTRGVIAGGTDQPTAQNVIDFITIASEGNAVDFGDSIGSFPYRPTGNVCNLTRGVLVAGGPASPFVGNIVEFITIATTGNGQDFGDLFQSTNDSGGACSDTHGGLSE